MMNRIPPQALIFDMDGLMTDTEPLYWQAAREMAAGYGKTVSDTTLRNMMAKARIESMRIFARDCGIAVSPERLLEDREVLMLRFFSAGVVPMKGLMRLLQTYHGKLKFAVATSLPKKFTDVILPALGAAGYFDVVQTGDDVVRGKPDPEIYFKAMNRLGVAPAAGVVLEDTRTGALAGKAAGARVIGVPTHLTAEEDFSFCDVRVEDLDQANRYIAGLLANPTLTQP
jgi:HAD superfamily hydrolase (TIGR01509 family)